ncbi:hypothetical protein BDK51DRAFT_47899 [Blyttiomyces helicus]|uniref:Uncharacterized protein n=1 Tax=Blyttiomyces helicus TaxID=388810 RepID=A0A4P9W404_9FUNG|nr:hypothetical protein BDK51DRAFT_47899 [Blyttiomyces helicus]|eukprot:RKO85548.1 hypothetical protein BDK51DRAFT_47899 [Blyttiomyces helicus]
MFGNTGRPIDSALNVTLNSTFETTRPLLGAPDRARRKSAFESAGLFIPETLRANVSNVMRAQARMDHNMQPGAAAPGPVMLMSVEAGSALESAKLAIIAQKNEAALAAAAAEVRRKFEMKRALAEVQDVQVLDLKPTPIIAARTTVPEGWSPPRGASSNSSALPPPGPPTREDKQTRSYESAIILEHISRLNARYHIFPS